MIFNGGLFPANRFTNGMTSSTTSVDLNFEKGEFVILGTQYAGEMKKGVFTIMNYLMPKRGMHVDALLGQRRPRQSATSRSSSASRAPARRRCRPTRTAS